MAVNNVNPIIEYTANGTTTDFSFPFLILDAGDLSVFFDGVEQSSGFTVSGVGNQNGGTVSFSNAPANGVVVRLQRIVALDRTNDYIEGGGLPSGTLDYDFDRGVMQVQDLNAVAFKENSDGFYDAKNKRIVNLSDPVDPTDAATKGYGEATWGGQAARDAENARDAAIAARNAAQVSEQNAATSEANAAVSEQNALTSEQNAATSEQNAASLYDQFDDRYLGTKSGDPTTDNDGNVLLEGALYWNSTNSRIRVFNGTAWQDFSTNYAGINDIATAERIAITDNDVSVNVPVKFSSGSAFRKNIIINGDMRIDQRNEGALVTGPGYDIDRWRTAYNTGALDKQRVTGFGGFDYARQVTVNTVPDLTVAGNYFIPIHYNFEGYDISQLKDKTVTLQFWFLSNVSGTFSIALRAGDLSQSYITDFDYTTAGTPQKIIKTLTVPASVITDTANNRGAQLSIANVSEATYLTSSIDTWITGSYIASTNATNWASAVGNYVSVTGVQLEVGDVATDFEFRPFAEELALCQRYYEKSYNIGVVPGAVTTGGVRGIHYVVAGTGYATIPTIEFAVQKRTNPAVVSYSYATGAAGFVSSAGADQPATVDNLAVSSCRIYWNDTATTKEYIWAHFTADAEL